MEHKNKHLFYLFFRFFIAVMFCNAITIAQESPPEEFVIGATLTRNTRHIQYYYDMFRDAGMNLMPQYADDISKSYLNGLNLMAYNSEFHNEWIYYYSTAYYSKWEAEADTSKYRVGFKHRDSLDSLIGSPDTLDGRNCWSTVGLTSPRDSLVYGPHYHQEKIYKRWYNEAGYDKYDLKYIPRFIMALKIEDGAQLNGTEPICRLSVVARYRRQENGIFVNDYDQDSLLKSVILYASDFQQYGTFKEFYLIDSNDYYIYPPEFRDPENGAGKRDFSHFQGVHFFDRWGDQGVQFKVDWLGDNSKCNLYIDYVEVYDNKGGQDFKDSIGLAMISNRIQTYASGFPSSQWPNMKYWGGCDEPSSLDNYIPLKTVDAALESIGAPRLITTFYPFWQVKVNEDTQLVRYYNTVQPAKLIIDFFPCIDIREPAGFEDWETTRKMLQICSSLQPGFWYQAQAAGIYDEGRWIGPRRPDSVEFKAQNMFALAHGVKGLIYWSFHSWGVTRGLLEPDSSITTALYDTIKYNIVPRLKSKLGLKLLGLNYTGDYLQYFYLTPTENTPSPPSFEYLTIGSGSPSTTMNWHCGFFESEYFTDDKYFMLANLLTTADRSVDVTIEPVEQDYTNYRFRNIEGGVDTSFTYQLTYQLTHPKGEGYLYEVAPVVKYGGKLIANDTVFSNISLIDNMTINNGKSIEIKSGYKYTLNDTVALLGTGFITGDGYLERNTNGWIIINQWDKSVFKGRVGDHPKIQWGKHPSFPTVQKYKIWRNKASAGWIMVKEVSGSVYEWIDSAVTIIEGPPSGNEVAAQYYVKASYLQGKIYMESPPSNTITYRRVEGSAWEKKNTGKEKIVYTYNLEQNYPNPFNPATSINYSLENSGNVELEIIDILGRRVALLVNEHQEKGNHSVSFNATNLSSGIYLYRIKSGKFVQTKKMLLLK